MPSIMKSPWEKNDDPHDPEDHREADAHQPVDRTHERAGGERLQKFLRGGSGSRSRASSARPGGRTVGCGQPQDRPHVVARFDPVDQVLERCRARAAEDGGGNGLKALPDLGGSCGDHVGQMLDDGCAVLEPEIQLGALRARKGGAQVRIGLEPDQVDEPRTFASSKRR
jgi:hypothetical protein